MATKDPSGPRCAALVGPYLSGKTSLLESILAATGAVRRKGTMKDANTIGDASEEARARQMSTEPNIASTAYLDDPWTFVDCPGSIELMQDTHNVCMIADVAVVVCEPEASKAITVDPVLRYLAERKIPTILFVNKMDAAAGSAQEIFEALREVSDRPLMLREVPIVTGEAITGHVDLVSERAFKWNENEASDPIELPAGVKPLEQAERAKLLESLADFDDTLLEKLLEDQVPSRDEIYRYLTDSLQKGEIVSVFFGSAERDNGITRLLKALRHEAPGVEGVRARLGVAAPKAEPLAQVFKTIHAPQIGKLSFVRVLAGEVKDGMSLSGVRVSGILAALGQKHDKRGKAVAGDTVSFGRMDEIATGMVLSESGGLAAGNWPEILKPVFSLAIHAEDRGDEVKLSGALSKTVDEDPSLSYGPNPDTGELLLWGQGEMHLLIALDRLKNRYKLAVRGTRPHVAYKETIRKPVSQHGRHKKQSGGHGQFGDVHLDIKPLPRGTGFNFNDSISGGVVPKQYIPAVESGVKDYMAHGPLGFPVVDIAVTLTDGQYHTVDSSEMAFKQAAQLAMREGMPKCNPILLEPIYQARISVPSEFTSKVQRLVSARRGQILGFDAKAGWKGWDEVMVQLPQSEMHDLIIDLRSQTLGVGTYDWSFDHLQEFSGKDADKIVAAHNGAAPQAT
ncbi:MAG: elongation factor G [Rhodospirillales bacterium]